LGKTAQKSHETVMPALPAPSPEDYCERPSLYVPIENFLARRYLEHFNPPGLSSKAALYANDFEHNPCEGLATAGLVPCRRGVAPHLLNNRMTMRGG
jgi:hypothetical protein